MVLTLEDGIDRKQLFGVYLKGAPVWSLLQYYPQRYGLLYCVPPGTIKVHATY